MSVRVLLVDDSEPWRICLRSLLKERPGLDVVGEAEDGLQAIEKAQELEPDLILLDVGMPRMHGLEAGKQLREIVPECKILFLSAERSHEFSDAALAAGAKDYIVKTDARLKLLPAIESIFPGILRCPDDGGHERPRKADRLTVGIVHEHFSVPHKR